MRILVAGGFGYVGGRIAQALCNAGHTVVLGTRQVVASPAWLSSAQVMQLCWQDRAALEESCRGIDAVVHAAGMNAQDCAADPVAALEFNGVATARLVSAAVRAGVPRFVYFSSAHVYAASLEGQITERDCPRNLHPYATSHLAGEQVVFGDVGSGKIRGTVLRLSNAFGPPTWDSASCRGLLVNDLCRQVVTTGELRLRTAGTQLRDFIPLGDVGRAVQHILSGDSAMLGDGLFNLGGDAVMSVFAMAELIVARWKIHSGKDAPIFRPEPSGPPPEPLVFSSEKLKSTGFARSCPVHQEIDATLGWCETACVQ